MPKLCYAVDDEENIRELLSATLSSGGYEARVFESGESFFAELERELPDIIVLDVMLPGQSGTEILKRLKSPELAAANDIPVIMLTARGAELDKVRGLELGADDYMVKPFGILELLARVNTVLRRAAKAAAPEDGQKANYMGLTIDFAARHVLVSGEPVSLTNREYELFLYLYGNRGVALSRDRLLENVWGYDYTGETRTVDAHIRSLRLKLGNIGQSCIVTARGYGYTLKKEPVK